MLTAEPDIIPFISPRINSTEFRQLTGAAEIAKQRGLTLFHICNTNSVRSKESHQLQKTTDSQLVSRLRNRSAPTR